LPTVIDKLPTMDFVFIDGGHSIKTICNDWHYVQKIMNQHTIVLFDDYWNIEEAGCKTLINNLDRDRFEVQILPPKDKFQKIGGL